MTNKLLATVGAPIFFVLIVGVSGPIGESHGAAIVGEPTRTEPASRPASTLEKLKAVYRRPREIPFPKDNQYTPQKAALGKKLFFDPRLSLANILSCASCHNPGFGWSDGQPKAVGHGMNVLERRSPTVINGAFGYAFMWDGRAGSLEEQALGPIQAAGEMNLSLEVLISRLTKINEYQTAFANVFPGESITAVAIGRAIATYERTIISGKSPFDEWVEGNEQAIPADAKKGFVLFNTKAGCAACHSDWRFTDDSFHDIGLDTQDIGRGRFLPDVIKMRYAFKTPTLRDVSLRPAFMHDGSLKTLSDVVDHYDRGGLARASRSDAVAPLGLSEQEKNDLIAFLNTLSGENHRAVVPLLPR